MKISRATEAGTDAVARLFDLYRQFYECESDIELSRRFIAERLHNNESTIFVAIDDEGVTRGFVQLYPSFCSIDAGKILILHDLFVESSVRKQGVGKMLMDKATEYARKNNVIRIDLLTDKKNHPGQVLYEKLGYEKTLESFFAYSLKI